MPERNFTLKLVVWLMTLGLLNACSKVSTSTSQTQEADQSQVLFPIDVPVFEFLTRDTGGNHPNHYSASGDQTKISTDYVGTYGTQRIHSELDYRNGLITVQRKAPEPQNTEVLRLLPPDQGGTYFLYLDALEHIADVLQQVEASTALNAVQSLSQRIKQIEWADEVRLESFASVVVLGQPLTLTVDYKVKANRELLVSLCDASQCYNQDRFGFAGPSGTMQVQMLAPQEMQRMDSAYLSIKVVPAGAEWTAKVFETNHTVRTEEFYKIEAYAPFQQEVGTSGSVYVLYRSLEPVTLALKWIDASGRIVAEELRELSPSSSSGLPSNTQLSFNIPADAALGEAQLWMRLYGKDGSWKRYLAEYQGSSKFAKP